MSVPAYRVTSDDLPDGDKKFQRAISPLLDALNRCLTAVIAAVNALGETDVRRLTLNVGGTVAASFPLKVTTSISNPSEVVMNLIPNDVSHSLTTPFVLNGWKLTQGAIQIQYITGLVANNAYTVTFAIR